MTICPIDNRRWSGPFVLWRSWEPPNPDCPSWGSRQPHQPDSQLFCLSHWRDCHTCKYRMIVYISGYPAHSHHDKIPPWWEYVTDKIPPYHTWQILLEVDICLKVPLIQMDGFGMYIFSNWSPSGQICSENIALCSSTPLLPAPCRPPWWSNNIH